MKQSNVIVLNPSQVQPNDSILDTARSLGVSTSYIQDQAHQTKTEAFVAIQPSQIGAVLADYGFNLVHLKTGQARKVENRDHQTTIARYRNETMPKINGLFNDLVFKVPHLYGALQSYLGTYRQVCSNGLVVGEKFYIAPRIVHRHDALSQLEALIPTLVAKHDEMSDSIREMMAREATPTQVADFVREIAHQRLNIEQLAQNGQPGIVSVQYGDLMRLHRTDDSGRDAFTVLNVVQENIMRYGVRYQSRSVDAQGRDFTRNLTARPVLTRRGQDAESVRSVDLNASLWDAAAKILMAA